MDSFIYFSLTLAMHWDISMNCSTFFDFSLVYAWKNVEKIFSFNLSMNNNVIYFGHRLWIKIFYFWFFFLLTEPANEREKRSILFWRIGFLLLPSFVSCFYFGWENYLLSFQLFIDLWFHLTVWMQSKEPYRALDDINFKIVTFFSLKFIFYLKSIICCH